MSDDLAPRAPHIRSFVRGYGNVAGREHLILRATGSPQERDKAAAGFIEALRQWSASLDTDTAEEDS